MSSFKIGGFKPIGQASSAVRRFFPGDDDEREDVEKRQTSPLLIPASHYRPPVPAPLVQNGKAPFNSSESFHRSHYDPAPRSPYSIAGRPLSNSPVHPASYPGHDEKIYERPAMHDYAHYYEHDQSRDRDQRETAYYHDEQHFPRHNGHEYPPSHDQDDAKAHDHDFPHARDPELTRSNTPNKSSCDELYSIVSQVGEGTFGKVYKARNTVSGLFVALKRIRMESERDGFPVTAMREIKLLQSLRHDNIVQLYEMMVSNGTFSPHPPIPGCELLC
jgi:CTD kinase subunit alpha